MMEAMGARVSERVGESFPEGQTLLCAEDLQARERRQSTEGLVGQGAVRVWQGRHGVGMRMEQSLMSGLHEPG